MISETKGGGTFLSLQIQVYGFTSPYRPDRNDRGEGRLLFKRENLIARLLSRRFFSMTLKYYKLNINKKSG